MRYINQKSIDSLINAIDIEDVVSRYVDLKKKGNNLVGNCPFHDEKTGSFSVSPSKGIYKCFGCGEAGNAYSFVKKIDKLESYETFIRLAELTNFTLEYIEGESRDYKEKQENTKSLHEINQFASDFYHKNLLSNSEKIVHLAQRNVTITDIKYWQLGYADNKKTLCTILKENGNLSKSNLLGITTVNNGTTYETFYNRITIPIIDKKGNILGFGGKGEKPKYLNSSDSDIYHKDNILFGLWNAQESIRKQNKAILCEGYFDVISLHRAGITNAVASCGTAFTEGQAKLLKKHTSTAVLFYDNDKAGNKATEKALHILLQMSFRVLIVENNIPEADPDDIVQFFEKNNSPYELIQKHIDNAVDALAFLSEKIYANCDNIHQRGEAVDRIALLISAIGYQVTKEEYIKKISQSIGVSKATLKASVEKHEKDKVEFLKKEIVKNNESTAVGPSTDESRNDFYMYGFWADDRKKNFGYWFSTKEGNKCISNFLMESLFLIKNFDNSKRIFRIKNKFNVEKIVEIPIEAMTGLSKFQATVEKHGNFIWEGSQSQVNKLKYKLYSEEKFCNQIRNLGWQKEGFWAFANGIFHNGEFFDIDKYGIANHDDTYYFLPALSEIFSGDETSYQNDKKFIHIKKSSLTLKEYGKLFLEVFNEDRFTVNGTIALLYAIGAVFRDVVYKDMQNSFPILFLFGPPGTGKNQLAYGLLNLFGTPQDLLNLSNNTKASLSKKMAEFSNALVFLDEYKNGLNDDVVQFLKSLYDGRGRTKSEMTTEDRTITTKVNSAAIIAGQEKPVNDIALFTRTIFLSFKEREFNRGVYELLFNKIKEGATSILLELLQERKNVEAKFKIVFENTVVKLNQSLNDLNESKRKNKLEKIRVNDRVLNSYGYLLTILELFKNKLDFMDEHVYIQLFTAMTTQSIMIEKSNDTSTFWDYVQSMYYSGVIREGSHYRFDNDNGKSVIQINYPVIHNLYQKEHRQTSGKPGMDKSSLLDYLSNSAEYIGFKSSIRFLDDFGNSRTTSAHCFNYDLLSDRINLMTEKAASAPNPYSNH